MCKMHVSDRLEEVVHETETTFFVFEINGKELEVAVAETNEWIYVDGQPYDQGYRIELEGDSHEIEKLFRLFKMMDIYRNDLAADQIMAWKLLEMKGDPNLKE